MGLMEWTGVLGNVGEFLGSIAVIATLAYLAVQVRQNTEVLRDNAVSRVTESFSRYRHLLAQEGASETFINGTQSYEQLEPAEKVRFRAIVEEYFFAQTQLYEAESEGFADPNPAGLADLLSNPGVESWWRERRTIYPPQFIAMVDALVSDEA